MRHPVGLAVQIVESGRGWVVARYGLATRRHEVDWSNPKPPGAYLIKRVAGVWKKELAELPLEPWPLPGPIGIAGLVAAIDPPPLHPTAPGFWTRDPDGNLVELSVHADKRVVNLTGLPAAALEGQDVDFLIDPTNSPDVYYLKPRETLYAAVPTLTVPPVTHLKRYKLALAQFQAMALAPSVPEVAVREPQPRMPAPSADRPSKAAPKPSPQPPKVESERPAPVHYPVRRWVPIDEVTWHDEAVSAPQFGITRAHCDDAQEVFEPLKRQLAADAEGAKVRCVLDRSAEGRLVWTAQAPAGLIALFERRRRDEALEGVRVQTRPVTLTSISKALGHANPEDIIEDGDVVALERRDALRWLFARRSHDQEPYLWRDNALLIPLGDRGLFAWEHLKEDNATYLFWPKDVDALLDLVSRDQWRRELRERPQSEETAAAGGLKRVIHKGDIEGWQRRIQAAIDSAGRQAP